LVVVGELVPSSWGTLEPTAHSPGESNPATLLRVAAPRSSTRGVILLATYALLGGIAFVGFMLLVLPAP
jgi:hypothetical protein